VMRSIHTHAHLPRTVTRAPSGVLIEGSHNDEEEEKKALTESACSAVLGTEGST
jgi:hypothetical protein